MLVLHYGFDSFVDVPHCKDQGQSIVLLLTPYVIKYIFHETSDQLQMYDTIVLFS